MWGLDGEAASPLCQFTPRKLAVSFRSTLCLDALGLLSVASVNYCYTNAGEQTFTASGACCPRLCLGGTAWSGKLCCTCSSSSSSDPQAARALPCWPGRSARGQTQISKDLRSQGQTCLSSFHLILLGKACCAAKPKAREDRSVPLQEESTKSHREKYAWRATKAIYRKLQRIRQMNADMWGPPWKQNPALPY